MTRDDEFIGRLRGYLDEYEGLTPLPEAVRDAVRAQLPTTKQIGPVSGLMRDLYMNRNADSPARWGLVAAVVIGAVIIGGAVLFGGGGMNVGGTATPSPAMTGAAESSPRALPRSGPLEPGRYEIPVHGATVRALATLGDGWAADAEGTAIVRSHAAIVFGTMGWTYRSECDPAWGDPEPSIGPSVQDLVAAIAEGGTDRSAPVPDTVGGFAGWRVELMLVTRCPDGSMVLLGRPTTVWILDVDEQRVVIEAYINAYDPDDEETSAIISEVIDSVSFASP